MAETALRAAGVSYRAEEAALALASDLQHQHSDRADMLSRAARGLADTLSLNQTVLYRLTRFEPGLPWAVELLELAGPLEREAFSTRVVEVCSRHTACMGAYDLTLPEPHQRNRAVRPRALVPEGWHELPIVAEVEHPLGLTRFDELRALVCDGPELLAWVGGWREEPFGAAEFALLESLVPPLREALERRRYFAHLGLQSAGLTAALEAIDAPAFVASLHGAVVCANTPGLHLLRHTPRRVGAELVQAIDGQRTPGRAAERAGSTAAPHSSTGADSGDSAYTLTPLRLSGLPLYYLAVSRRRQRELSARLAELRSAWRLTPRQAEVLRLLLSGKANKSVALLCGISTSAVEQHLSALFRKAGVQSRAELMSAVWTE